jgi:1,2-phenylacetyl-CoA epoxidase catalytic subunit
MLQGEAKTRDHLINKLWSLILIMFGKQNCKRVSASKKYHTKENK